LMRNVWQICTQMAVSSFGVSGSKYQVASIKASAFYLHP